MKMIPSMGIYGSDCPIIWRSTVRNENGTRNIIILISKSPPSVMPGEVDDGAYDALPETIAEW